MFTWFFSSFAWSTLRKHTFVKIGSSSLRNKILLEWDSAADTLPLMENWLGYHPWDIGTDWMVHTDLTGLFRQSVLILHQSELVAFHFYWFWESWCMPVPYRSGAKPVFKTLISSQCIFFFLHLDSCLYFCGILDLTEVSFTSHWKWRSCVFIWGGKKSSIQYLWVFI